MGNAFDKDASPYGTYRGRKGTRRQWHGEQDRVNKKIDKHLSKVLRRQTDECQLSYMGNFLSSIRCFSATFLFQRMYELKEKREKENALKHW